MSLRSRRSPRGHLPVSHNASFWRLALLAILAVPAGCGGGSGEETETFWHCRYQGGPGAWKYRCDVVAQCDMSEPCDGSDPDNCEPGRTTCLSCPVWIGPSTTLC